MGFSEAVKRCLTQYATFSGRAGRAEYWWFFAFLLGVHIIAGLVSGALFPLDEALAVSGLLTLALLCPSLAVGARRLHDTDRSGWWLAMPWGFAFLGELARGPSGSELLGSAFRLLSFASFILLLYWLIRPGTPGENRFGPPPL